MRAPGRAALRHAARISVAALLAYGGATVLGLPQPYWAVITAFVIVQGSLGGTLRAGLDRLVGTLSGAVVGGIAGWLAVRLGAPVPATFVVLVPPLSLLAVLRQSFRLAPVTAAIVMLGGTSANGPLLAALDRATEIGFGCVLGVAVAHFVFPGRARHLMAEAGRALLLDLADLTRLYLTDAPAAELDRLNSRARGLMTQLTAAADAEANERAIRLSQGSPPSAVLRSLRRVRYDVAILSRAVAVEPPADHSVLAACLDDVLSRAAAMFAGDEPPDLTRLDEAIAALPVASPLAFALGTLRRDLDDLLARVTEAEGIRAERAGVKPG